MQKVFVEIEHACGDWKSGDRVKLEQKRATKLIRTGYARLIETTDADGDEQAVRPQASTRTVRGERRG